MEILLPNSLIILNVFIIAPKSVTQQLISECDIEPRVNDDFCSFVQSAPGKKWLCKLMPFMKINIFLGVVGKSQTINNNYVFAWKVPTIFSHDFQAEPHACVWLIEPNFNIFTSESRLINMYIITRWMRWQNYNYQKL